jgi:hypothetical protein
MIEQTLDAILNELKAINATLAGRAPAAHAVAATPAAAVIAPAATTATGQPITADAITALIQPHIANDAIKTALGAAMRGMGINSLPETQPHQFPSLYQAFENVIKQHVGGAVGAAVASII